MTEDVLTFVEHGVGRIRLNRPKALHALTTAMFGPRIPYWIATCPDAESGSMCGSMNGETRRGPRSSSV